MVGPKKGERECLVGPDAEIIRNNYSLVIKNPNVKVLGLSATPVVNNLREGRSLLKLISGKVYDDVAIRPTIPNAVTLYEKLSAISIRELARYSIDVDTHIIDVTAPRPPDISVRNLKSNPLAIEKYLTSMIAFPLSALHRLVMALPNLEFASPFQLGS
jgi:hypothetical protein